MQDEQTFYVTDSLFRDNRQWQAVYRADHPDGEPDLLVDLGVRTCRDDGWTGGMCFNAGLVHDGHLHLLASASRLTPNWIAINLNTLRISALVSEFPHEFRHNALQLHPSNQYGVVLLRGKSVPYQVNLPPAEHWPSFDKVVEATRLSAEEAREFLADQTR